MSRSIVIANWALTGRSGTETFVRDLASALKRRGWTVTVFTCLSGPIGEELQAQGIPVVTRPEDLPADAEIVHGHHHFVAAIAMIACPQARGLYLCHDATGWHDRAPRFPRMIVYAGVDRVCRERVAQDVGMPLEQVRFFGNSVDLGRFRPRPPLPPKLRRALLFSNYATEYTFLPPVRQACQELGLELDLMGSGVQSTSEHPEDVLPGYDVVFGKGRCAMEALASGCATVLCGLEGLGPLVTGAHIEALRENNFGRRCLTRNCDVAGIKEAVAAYDPHDCAQASLWAREHLDHEKAIQKWESLYEEMVATPISNNPREECQAAGEILSSLALSQIRRMELEIHQVQTQHQHGAELQKLRDQLEGAHSECQTHRKKQKVWREKAEERFSVTGLLSRLWDRPWSRPLAKAMGLRRPIN